jgi:hypothetical protein
MITYEVMQVKPLSMRESVRGDGKRCGAALLDQNLIRLVQRKAGEAWWDSLSPRAVEKFLDEEVDVIKQEFDDSENDRWGGYTVRLPSGGGVSRVGFRDRDLDLSQ